MQKNRYRSLCIAALVFGGAAGFPGAAAGQVQSTLTRPLGMGGAFRAHGTGNGALYYNPAGMSLVNTYSIEGAYLDMNGKDATHLSIVDTKTSALGAGLGYTYVPTSGAADDHEVRVGLSTALVPQMFTIGILGKYDWLGRQDVRGFSLDAGALLVGAKAIGLGAVVHNLMPNSEVQQRRTFGFGLAYLGPLTAAFDLVLDPALDGSDKFSYHGGLEVLVGEAFPLRLGYENIPTRAAQFLTLGIGAFSEVAGLQLGFEQRIDQGDEQSLAVSLSWFL